MRREGGGEGGMRREGGGMGRDKERGKGRGRGRGRDEERGRGMWRGERMYSPLCQHRMNRFQISAQLVSSLKQVLKEDGCLWKHVCVCLSVRVLVSMSAC